MDRGSSTKTTVVKTQSKGPVTQTTTTQATKKNCNTITRTVTRTETFYEIDANGKKTQVKKNVSTNVSKDTQTGQDRLTNSQLRYQKDNKASYAEFKATDLKSAAMMSASPSTQTVTNVKKTTTHGQEYLASQDRVYGGRTSGMDSNLSHSRQTPDIQNFNEPKYVKHHDLLQSSPTQRKRQSAKKTTITATGSTLNKSQSVSNYQKHGFQGQRTITNTQTYTSYADGLGPGSYNVERSLDYTKSGQGSSPNMRRQTERTSAVREGVSPDQYSPNKETILYQAPKYTIGVRRPGQFEGNGDSEKGPGYYEVNQSHRVQGFSFGNVQESNRLLKTSTSFSAAKSRPKSNMVQRGRTKHVRNQNKTITHYDEIESFNEPVKFGDNVKGMKFGAPKTSTTLSTKRHSKATTTTRAQKQQFAAGDGEMSMMTQIVFQEEAGPDMEVEHITKSRSTAVLRATQSAKPVQAQATPQKKLKSSFSTAKAPKRKQVEIGPGQYDIDSSAKITKSRTRSALMSKTNRPDINKRTLATGDLGPGQYDGGKQFGKDIVGYSWGKPKAPKQEIDNRDYGYEPEKEFKQTRHKSPSATINSRTPSRPSTFANKSMIDTPAGGQYKQGPEFGEQVKGYSWGKPKNEKVEIDNRDYGYEPEKEFTQTRHRSPAAIINKSTPGRPKSFALEQSAAPGQYESHKQFGQEVKSMTFQKTSREQRKVDSGVAPGQYDVERSTSLIKCRSQAAIINKGKARPDTFASKEHVDSAAPGQYSVHKEFGKDNVKSFRIGTRSPVKFETTAGPGQYDVDRSVSVTKQRVQSGAFSKTQARPKSFAIETSSAAVGQYDDGIRFNSNVKSFKIGEKRAEKMTESMGPGAYSPERADAVTKTKIVNINMGASPARPAKKTADVDVAPGQYDDGIRFNQNVKSFKIGEKRTEKMTESMGPGAYSPERADAITKTKIVNINMGASPARPAKKSADVDVAPGQYDDGIRFNSNVKSFRIGEKREEKMVKTMGPGQYEPDRADAITKTKIVSVTMGASPARPVKTSVDVDVAPGQYDDGVRWNSNVKSFKIGEKRAEKTVEGMGPGAYSPERADAITKTKIKNVNIGQSAARAVSKTDVDVAPGQYDDGVRWNSNVKSFKIGEKRSEKMTESMGPGAYSPERADAVTKTKIVNINMGASPARPAKKTADVDVAPGQYDDGVRWNSNVKSFRIGEKRFEKVVEGMGPGAYSPERADGLTKTKIANINMGSSPARVTKRNDVDVAPGQYDDGIRFNQNVKSFRIGEKREEKITESMGPGAYSPERADAITKTKTVNINMGSSASRPSTFAKGGDYNVAPGQYDDGMRFNSNVKSFRIGEKRTEIVTESMGPGAYDHERADAVTKTKMANINMGSSPARATKRNDVDVAPGQYDDGIRFNSNVKSFKIGEKRTEKMTESMGPGAYSPERADAITKTKTVNINMGSSPARVTKRNDVDVAPGQYDDGVRWNSNVKSFRIGEKREEKIVSSMGPGAYDHERADAVTKTKMANINMGSSPARATKRNDVDVAPGQYDDGVRWNSNVKSFKIGEKREEKMTESMGPGAYSPERADGLTKTKIANINMGSSPSRPITFAKGEDYSVAPGQYDDGKNFGSDTKAFRIGEKRETRIQETMGPGSYNPERAEAMTKTKITTVNMSSSPSRPGTFAKGADYDVAPGQYDDRSHEFGKNVKSFTIGEKRETRVTDSMGPGSYNPDIADRQTKTRSVAVNMASSPGRPNTFAKASDVNVAPGQYDDGMRFNSNVKSFKIGEKRTEKIVEGMGPGAYNPERAEAMTKTKTSTTINMASSPGRPGTFAKKNDYDVSPGQYDDRQYEFGKNVKSFTIGEKRETRVTESMGPGSYNPERGESMTKTKTTTTINMASSPSRPNTFAKASDVNVAPGQYDDRQYEFGKNVKSFTIGEKRETRVTDSMGPGSYNPEKAEAMTKTKTTTTINMSSSPSRPSTFAKANGYDVSPGQYDDRSYQFGNNAKGFTIGEKRETRVTDSMGPGSYNPERAESMTKTKTTTTINMGSSPGRPSTFAKNTDVNVSPGQYDDRNYQFGSNAKGFTIGEKRETKVSDGIGPGAYNPERAESMTKTKTTTTINMSSSPSRPSTFARANDSDQSPGQYDDRSYKFGNNAKGFTIGEKRETKIESTVGPGSYDVDRASNLTKPKLSNINMGSSPSRPDRLGQTQISSSASEQRFSFTNGQKRNDRKQVRQYQSHAYNTISEETKQDSTGPSAANKQTSRIINESYKTLKPKVSSNLMTSVRSTNMKSTVKQRPVTSMTTNTQRHQSTTMSTGKPKVSKKTTTETITEGGVTRTITRTFTTTQHASSKKVVNSSTTKKSSQIANNLTVTKQTASSTLRAKSAIKGTVKKSSNLRTSQNSQMRTGRQTAMLSNDITSAPGSYDVKGMSFGENTKSFTIGVKRDSRVEQSPGPGSYDQSRSESQTKHRSPNTVDFDRTTGRMDGSPARDTSGEVGNQERFYQYPKQVPVYSIGERRPEKPKDGPGPGEYNLDDSAVKPRTMGHHQF